MRRIFTAVSLMFASALVVGCAERTAPSPPPPAPWEIAPPMTTARGEHTATALADGRVLVAGGWDGTARTATAEAYNEPAGRWDSISNMTVARQGHRAVRLANGQLLVVDGTGTGSCELYDPSTGTWSATGSMSLTRTGFTTSLLGNGRVLVVGDPTPGTSAELYDPATGTWTTTGSLNVARSAHAATRLVGGKVLVAGGWGASAPPIGAASLASAELYDPATGTWTLTGSLAMARHRPHLLPLSSGDVMLVGGATQTCGGPSPTAEIYAVGTGSWHTTDTLSGLDRLSPVGVAIDPAGRLVSAGGYFFYSDPCLGGVNPTAGTVGCSYRLDPASGAWTELPELNQVRSANTLTRLPSGRLLAAGGYVGSGAGVTGTAEVR